jgi:hypothetical protein
MKNYLSLIILLGSTLTAFAQDIEIYIECRSKIGCKEMQVGDEKILFESKPSMTFNKDNVTGAYLEKKNEKEFRYQDGINLGLNAKATAQLAELTAKNIDKAMGLVYNGQLLMAPRLQSEIPDGHIRITFGKNTSHENLLDVPWLKEKLNSDAVESKKSNNRSFILYFALAVAVVGGALYFAFSKRRITN